MQVRACPIRSAVSAVIDRRPWTISLMRRGWNTDRFRQTILADTELVENFRQVFSGMNRVDLVHEFAPYRQLDRFFDCRD
ncbi:MAG: hypothetical protein OXB98_17515 [Bryobacterales bacterium]|nr:hypothetical protein [Bryobacterales bacterium]